MSETHAEVIDHPPRRIGRAVFLTTFLGGSAVPARESAPVWSPT